MTYAAFEQKRSFTSAPDPIRSVLQHSKSHPRMLESECPPTRHRTPQRPSRAPRSRIFTTDSENARSRAATQRTISRASQLTDVARV